MMLIRDLLEDLLSGHVLIGQTGVVAQSMDERAPIAAHPVGKCIQDHAPDLDCGSQSAHAPRVLTAKPAVQHNEDIHRIKPPSHHPLARAEPNLRPILGADFDQAYVSRPPLPSARPA
jgi:hypothetical protein